MSSLCLNVTCSSLNTTINPCSRYVIIPPNGRPLFQAVALLSSVITSISSADAVAGNVLVLLAIWKNPSLRTPSYVILSGLAFTDLMTGLVTGPLHIASEVGCLQEPNRIKQYWNVAIAAGLCGSYFIYLTELLITLMSVERWLHMTRRSLLNVGRSCLIVAIISLLLLFALLYGFLRSDGVSFLSMYVIIFLFSAVLTSVSYFKVYRIIRRHQQQVHANQNFGQPAINLEKYKKSVYTILYILGVFYICYLPLSISMGFVIAFKTVEAAFAMKISTLFVLIASSINPLIYIWRIHAIRNEVKRLLRRVLRME